MFHPGEHLLATNAGKPVAIIEGQSTMLFMAALGKAALKYHISLLSYFDHFTWIATGGSDGIGWKDEQVLQALKGKDVVLFPDAGFYDQWLCDAELMQEFGINVKISQHIESKYKAGQLKRNEDLRDYFMLYANDIKQHCKPIITIPSDLLNIYSTDIMNAPLGQRINSASIFHVETANTFFDLLFDNAGELMQPGNEQKFIPGLMDGAPCFIHIYN